MAGGGGEQGGSATYPPEPWVLAGRAYLSVWSVPRAALPALPEGLARVVRPVTVGGRGLVGTAWVVYGPGGMVRYRELLSAVLVRDGVRPRVSITDIWVDSEVSRHGGRELWGIPKELADLEIATTPRTAPADGGRTTGSAATAAGPIARALVTPRLRLPGRWPLRFRVAQLLGERVRSTPVRCRTGVGIGSATWQVPPTGPLAYLAGRRPLLTLALRDAQLIFGSAGAGDRPDR